MRDRDVIDLLVIGGGMAGCSAAAYAASHGASVALVEKAASVGGSAQYAGFIWTTPTAEAMAEVNPEADPALTQVLVDGYERALAWVRSLDIAVGDPVAVLRYGRGCHVDLPGLLEQCKKIVEMTPGCQVITNATVESLLTNSGTVAGAVVSDQEGTRHEIRARFVLLATGGFSANEALRATYLHPQAASMTLRSHPLNVGDGLRLGQEVGAAMAGLGAGFYGHLIPSNIEYRDPYEFALKTTYHSEHGTLVNVDGQRFCDETIGDHLNANATLEQPEARALLIYDQQARDQWELTSYVEGIAPVDKFELALRSGGRCAVAQDLEEFAYLPPEWGYPGEAVMNTIATMNDAIFMSGPIPARSLDSRPLDHPPYYCIEVIPAVTFTYPGLAVDPQARVLDAGAHVIPGLLAAGADAGGVFANAYAGGLCLALTYGLQAANTALSAIGGSR